MDTKRKLVFISHANPEDNQFVLWLASRLTSLGYLVWSDVTELFGAEKFWRDIEDAIRTHSAKVIVVLSRVAQQKEGVLNEIHTALAVEKSNGLDRFVMPIRIDDLPSTDVISPLIQRNYIDFYKGWAAGLNNLLTFLEKSNVPCNSSQEIRQTSQWIESLLAGPESVVAEPQSLASNWFAFDSLPEHLNYFRVPVPEEKVRSAFGLFPYAVYPYRGMVATFASLEDVDSFLPQWQSATVAYTIPLQSILNNEPHRLTGLEWNDASRLLFYLLRVSWDNAMRAKRLHAYQMANGRQAWYPVTGYTTDNWVRYPDLDGVERKKRLIGYSKKRNVHWHFAMEVVPYIGSSIHLVLKPHVAFSDNGIDTLDSDRRMHSLRRSFCKNWWNARWRDLMLAYATYLSEGTGCITIPVGAKQVVTVMQRPMMFDSPVSLHKANKAAEIELDDETDDQLDELDSEYGWGHDDGVDEDDALAAD